jgi:hypothetical protein
MQVKDVHIHIPAEYARHCMPRAWRRFALFWFIISVSCVLLSYLEHHNWQKSFSDNIGFLVVIGFGNLAFHPWLGTSVKTWEWYFSRYGISLRDISNPMYYYGIVFISRKRDTLLAVEQVQWENYPALKIVWRYGKGRRKSMLLVYQMEEQTLVDQHLLPQLLGWPQQEIVNA